MDSEKAFMQSGNMALAGIMIGLAMASVAAAQNNPPAASAACSGPTGGLPAALAGWNKVPVSMTTARDPAEAATLNLPLEQRIAFRLTASLTMQFVHPPSEQMPKQYIYSGMASFSVPKDGAYSVMISEANWIDVIQNGEVIRSLEMRGRVPCAKYGKKIDFPLKAGTAIVQFFGAPYETVDVLIAPVL
jgi:hypothetical protein